MERYEQATQEAYFNWLVDHVCGGRYIKLLRYGRLLRWLHKTEFIYFNPMDLNRVHDAIDFRRRFGYEGGNSCSVLEMMVALAVRCEEHIMGDSDIGDRTGEWFWEMIYNLGLENMDDANFDPEYVDTVTARLLHREYGRNGEGGLFTVTNRAEDMRTVDIWYQMAWYLAEREGYNNGRSR